MRAAEAWQVLCDAALVSGDAPEPTGDRSPWYVKAMLGFAGWIAAMFLLGFVGAIFALAYESTPVGLLIGAATLYAARLIYLAAQGRAFMGQFGLAISLAGQGILGFAVFRATEGNTTAGATIFALVEIGLIGLIADAVHRGWSTLVATAMLAFVAHQLHLLPLAPGLLALVVAWLWRTELAWGEDDALFRPLAYALALGAIGLDAFLAVERGLATLRGPAAAGAATPYLSYFGVALGILALASVVWDALARHSAAAPARALALGATVAAGSVAFIADGFATALLLLLIGVANANRVLLGLGAFLALASLSNYYYALDATLLRKSAVLLGTGLALLAARHALRWTWSERHDA